MPSTVPPHAGDASHATSREPSFLTPRTPDPSPSPKRSRALTRRGVLLGALGAAAAACSSKSHSASAKSQQPRRGGVLRIALPAEAGLAPWAASHSAAIDGNRVSALYDPLVISSPSTGGVQPHLAVSLSPDQTSRVWTLKLRPGVRFSDNTVYDAAAVEYTWKQHLNPAYRSEHAPAMAGVSLKVIDPLTLRITLPAVNGNFDHTVAKHLAYVGSPTAIRANPQAFAKKPVGAGPYMLSSWQPGATQSFVRNPHYWQPGKPNLDQLVFTINPELERSAQVLLDNQQDVSIAAEAQSAGKLLESKVNSVQAPLDGATYLCFNARRPPFDDPRVRQAVCLSLSAKDIQQRVFDGYGTASRGIFSSTSRFGDIQLSQLENDPARAAALFRQLADEGKKLDINFLGPKVEVIERLMPVIAEKLKPYPEVSFRSELVSTSDYVARALTQLDYEMSTNTLWMDAPDPELWDFVHSTSPTNLTGYRNKDVDAALVAARTTTDQELQRNAYTQVQLHLNQDVPFWGMQEATMVVGSREDVVGVEVFNDGLILFDRIGLRA